MPTINISNLTPDHLGYFLGGHSIEPNIARCLCEGPAPRFENAMTFMAEGHKIFDGVVGFIAVDMMDCVCPQATNLAAPSGLLELSKALSLHFGMVRIIGNAAPPIGILSAFLESHGKSSETAPESLVSGCSAFSAMVIL